MKKYNMKDFVTAGVVLLIAVTILAVMREQAIKEDYNGLQKDNEKLVEQIVKMEEELDGQSSSSKELEKENKRLTEDVLKLEGEVEALKTPVNYQDILEAIKLVESYKEAKSFEEASKFIAFNIGNGMTAQDSSLTCPCFFVFNEKSVEWIQNAVHELETVRTEKDRIILTYNTVKDIGEYEFVMTKAMGRDDPTEKWRIEKIKPESNKN
ncbi:hypothetical protein V7112_15840 [Bacillus sp. JJ1566]|uniref:hypothetical protein n=1 Tax=Bacillus sp. JJ1566 TaxID=3122961 RepID=UPI002FFEF42B